MKSGIDLSNMDLSVSPATDFYNFVNGGWMARTEIPSDRASWGSFHELAKETDYKVLDLLRNELQESGPSENIAARLFESGMDIDHINRQKLNAIQSWLKEIRNITNYDQLAQLLGRMVRTGLGAFLHYSIHPHLGDSKKYAAYLEPASTGLPEREFYLDDDDKAKEIRSKYLTYIQYILQAEAGAEENTSDVIAKEILDLETMLAREMMTKEDRRQLDKIYNPIAGEKLEESFPGFSWNNFFEGLQVERPDIMIVTDPSFITLFSKHMKEENLTLIRQYLIFLTIHHCAPYAHKTLEEKHFDLFSRTLDGIEHMRPRDERMVKVVNQMLGESMGQLFVEKYFPAAAKEAALEMVSDIVSAFANRIRQLTWMSDDTREYALEKLYSFKVKIGYPDKWKDYSGLEIKSGEEGNYLQNILNTVRWKFQKDINRLHENVDRDEWFMAPQVVNAYYNPMFNEIVFPAAILQPPFFDYEAEAAVNYGGIGAVIGHEITHGFDDQGSHFDKEGNYREWWTAEDREQFTHHTAQLIEQANAYRPIDDLPLNGAFTLGENIADLGGLSVAYDALQLYYQRHGRPPKLHGYTSDQRFFMSWATVWRTKIRPEALRTQIKTDPHPPGAYRAVAAPSNMEAFYDAFRVDESSNWYRPAEERIKIW